MSLARAEGPFQGAAKVTAVSGSALVIAVAPEPRNGFDSHNRGGPRTVVLVGTRAEAIAVLLGGPPAPAARRPMFGVPPPAAAEPRPPAGP